MMKKIAIGILALMLLVMAACGVTEDEPAPAAMVNPMTEVESLAALSEAANCALIQPQDVDIEDEQFFLIEAEPQIAEYQFTVNDTPCSLRFANVGIETDICGIYGEDGTLFADSQSETHYYETDEVKVQRWFTVDGQYVFAVTDNSTWDWTQYDAICSQFMNMEPKNWSSGAPFADYLALTGYYMDEASHLAAINIKYDHAAVFVQIDDEEAGKLVWEMDAVLEGDRLVYGKEVITSYQYDEATGETTEEALAEGGAGYIEIKDGSLYFNGAASEQLRDLVLAPQDIRE